MSYSRNPELYWVAGILLVIFGLMAWIVMETSQQKLTFMDGCLKDHKQYECDVLWAQASRSGSSDMATGMVTGMAIGIAAGGRR